MILSDEDQAAIEQLQRLTAKTERILTVLRHDGILLSDPENILALQAVGIVVAQAMGADPAKVLGDLIQVVDSLAIDLNYIRTLLQEPV